MTVEELYQELGGDYKSVMERLGTEERVSRFVRLFLQDASYEGFEKALEAGDTREAFRQVHTLKGVAMNLNFDSLYKISSALTELLRRDEFLEAVKLAPALKKCYEAHCHAIDTYVREEG